MLATLRAEPLTGVAVDDAGNPVPLATVTFVDRITGETAQTLTDAQGRFRFENAPAIEIDERVDMLAQGSLYVEAELPGMRKATGRAYAGDDVRLVLTRDASVAAGAPYLAAVVDAASFRPGYFPESGLIPGSIVAGFGENLGPGTLLNVSEVPLPGTLGGFTIRVFTQDAEYPGYPIFIGRNQFAAVLDGGIPAGPATIRISFEGRESNPLGVFIDAGRLSFFTVNQSGQGPGVFTFADFTPVTYGHSAKPGDIVIPWFTGGGGATFPANQGGVFDYREAGRRFDFFLGNVPVPDADVPYLGASGFAGLGQGAITIPEGAPLGCGVPLLVRTLAGGLNHVSNPVTIPISADGGPCGDPHPGALPRPLVTALAAGEQVPRLRTVTEWTTNYNRGAEPQNTTSFRVLGDTFSERTYTPPNAANTCHYQWSLLGQALPASRWSLIAGRVTQQVPGMFLEAGPTSNAGPFWARSGWSRALFDRIADGPGTLTAEDFKYISFFGGETATVRDSVPIEYSHESWRFNDRMNLSLAADYSGDPDALRFGGIRDAQEQAQAAGKGNIATETAFLVAVGERGSHLVTCNNFPSLPLSEVERSLEESIARFLSRLAPSGSLGTARAAAFTWDPFNNDRTVIRGGSGVYYAPMFSAAQQFAAPAGRDFFKALAPPGP